ncbi:DUF1279 super [Coniosporium apollinis]|uniref:DUF1279 super n=1 Tax=Coniosporium apollinis TaxID=61459 RepID=A0ABQ9NL14_9PEZI|nr:DUF1279 super [Coniosporium apollinis]
MLGTERIGHWEHVVIENFWKVVQIPFPNLGRQRQTEEAVQATEQDGSEVATAREGALGWTGEVDAADKRNKAADATAK